MRYVLISHISNQETNRMMKIIKKPISITLYTDEWLSYKEHRVDA